MKAKKRALGRGLDAILQSPDTDITSRDISGDYVAGAIANIRLSQIESNPFQPRMEFEEEALVELAASIREQGIIQPITVRKMGYDKYQLISGERRLRASKLAGQKEIPAYIRVANDEQMLEMALIENIHREDLNPVDIAISYQRLIEECNLTQEDLSTKVGKDRATISNYIRLLKLPAEVQLALRNKQLTMGHAKTLITIPDREKQIILMHLIIRKELSVREAEKIAKHIPEQSDTTAAVQPLPLPLHLETYRNLLRDKLSTRISVKRSTKGKGSIVISFGSEPELERILRILNQS